MNRRRFLGGTVATMAVCGCSSHKRSAATRTSRKPAPTTTTTAPRRAGDRPDPSKPEGTDMLAQIEHVVVLMMENHSYDNYFGLLGRGDGFTVDGRGHPTDANRDVAGNTVKAFHMANTCQLPRQPSQNWNATHVQWEHGAMDGFVRSESGPVSMGYWTGDDLPFYYGLARTFPLCDRWFGSCMGQTFPNRRFLLAATARGNISTDLNTIQQFQPPNGTIMDALGRHGIGWRNYYSNLPTTALFSASVKRHTDRLVPIAQFFTDAKAGTLPAFSLVDPDFDRASEENSDDITLGEGFAARVINAVMAGRAWSKTLLIWTYDEHGGYYDHVPPPVAVPPDRVPPRLEHGDVPGNYGRYGFRVPAVVVSPYARRDYVSHVVHDHTSILKLIETKFNLPALTDRDAAADNLLDSLDLSATPAFLTPPTLPGPRNSTNVALCRAPGPIPNPQG